MRWDWERLSITRSCAFLGLCIYVLCTAQGLVTRLPTWWNGNGSSWLVRVQIGISLKYLSSSGKRKGVRFPGGCIGVFFAGKHLRARLVEEIEFKIGGWKRYLARSSGRIFKDGQKRRNILEVECCWVAAEAR